MINIEGAKSEKKKILPSNIDNIYQYPPFQIVCPRKTLPCPQGSFHLAPISRVATSRFDMSIMAALKVCTKALFAFTKETENPATKWSFLTKVENKDLESFLEVLRAFEVDQRAKERPREAAFLFYD